MSAVCSPCCQCRLLSHAACFAAWASIDEVLPVKAASIAWAKSELAEESRWNSREFDESLRILLAAKSGEPVDAVPTSWLIDPPQELCSESKVTFTGTC